MLSKSRSRAVRVLATILAAIGIAYAAHSCLHFGSGERTDADPAHMHKAIYYCTLLCHGFEGEGDCFEYAKSPHAYNHVPQPRSQPWSLQSDWLLVRRGCHIDIMFLTGCNYLSVQVYTKEAKMGLHNNYRPNPDDHRPTLTLPLQPSLIKCWYTAMRQQYATATAAVALIVKLKVSCKACKHI